MGFWNSVPIVRLQRFEQSQLRWTIYRSLGKLPGLGTDRIAARLHCHASDGRPLIYNIIKCSIGQDAFWCRCYSTEPRMTLGAQPNSIHSEFKLMLRLSCLSFVTYFRFSLLPLSPSFTSRFTRTFSADEFHYSACLSRECIRACRCIYACPRIILGRFSDVYTCVHSYTAYNTLSLQWPEVTDRACSREEYLEKWQRDRGKINVEVDEMYTEYIFRLDCGSNSGNWNLF